MIDVTEKSEVVGSAVLTNHQRELANLIEGYYGRVLRVERLYRKDGRLTSDRAIGRIEYLHHEGSEATKGLKANSLLDIGIAGRSEVLWIWPNQSRVSVLQEDINQWSIIHVGKDWDDRTPDYKPKEIA